MNAHSFRIDFANEFSHDDFKSIFSPIGNVDDVISMETTRGNTWGFTYIIHMKRWTKCGEYFRNDVLERGEVRYCYDDTGFRPLYFICNPC